MCLATAGVYVCDLLLSIACKHQLLVHVQVIGWENIELISDRPLETMLDEFKRLKQEYPDRSAVTQQLHDRHDTPMHFSSAFEELP